VVSEPRGRGFESCYVIKTFFKHNQKDKLEKCNFFPNFYYCCNLLVKDSWLYNLFLCNEITLQERYVLE
jgi:hypothetical protein